MDDRQGLEKVMNAHTIQWGRILRLSDKWNGSGQHWARIKSALKSQNFLAPPLYGMPKVFPAGQEDLGPPLRSVCGATESINGSLSDFLTEILTLVGDRADTSKTNCLSTEEMVEALSSYNCQAETTTNSEIFSMDVQAMFPNLDTKKVARVVAEEFLSLDLEIEVDTLEVSLYLAIKFQGKRRKELVDQGLEQVVHTRKFQKSCTILITTDEVLARGEKEDKQDESRFNPPQRQPTKAELRILQKQCGSKDTPRSTGQGC